MLKRDSLLMFSCFLLTIISCDLKKNTDNSKKINPISKHDMIIIYDQASDSVNSWLRNDLIMDTTYDDNVLYTCAYILDSAICINTNKTKMIGHLLKFNGVLQKYFSDGMEEFYGAKIDGRWYFWTGGYYPIPRSGFKNHDPKQPLSYAQLHSVVGFGPYLKPDGSINDAWFEAKFKDPSLGDFKRRYEFKSNLDGNRIDNEQEYWEYLWKRNGIGLWTRKHYQDSLKSIKKEKYVL